MPSGRAGVAREDAPRLRLVPPPEASELPEPRTTVRPRPDGGARPAPRRLGRAHRVDRLDLAGAATSSTCVTLLAFGRLAPLHGTLGFVVVDYLGFLLLTAVLTGLRAGREVVLDRVMTVLLVTAAAVLFGALAFVVAFTLWRGRTALGHVNFLTQDMSRAGPLDPLGVGGIRHALIGTGEQLGLALLFTVPLGVLCALYLSEVGDRFARLVRILVEAMTALPSIVAGLFIYMSAILVFGMPRSGLAASLAISVMMLPIIVRAADVVLRLVPQQLREAALAMGASRPRVVWHVVLPNARSGLVTAVILGAARGIGETSPLLLTAGATAAVNADPLHDPQVSLPLAAFEFVQSPQQAMVARGFATAAVLLLFVLVLFTLARLIGSGGGRSGTLARRRVRVGSLRDSQRIDARHAARVAPARVP